MTGERKKDALRIIIEGKAYADLRRMADERGQTMSAVIRDALRLENWIRKQQQNGATIVIKRSNGDLRALAER